MSDDTSLQSQAGLPDGMFSNQKIQIWVNPGGPCNEKIRYILRPFGIYYGHWEYITDIWYIFIAIW
jgi:hypothetical protein